MPDSSGTSYLKLAGLAVAGIILLSLFCGRLIYNCVFGPFPADAALLSAFKISSIPLKYYVTVKGETLTPTGYLYVSRRSQSFDPKEELVLLSVPPRLLAVKTRFGERTLRYAGKLETVPDDIADFIKLRIGNDTHAGSALLPIILNVTDDITLDLAMYEFGCLILAFGALYAGFRFWRRPRNSSVEPSVTELRATTCGALRIAHTGEIGKIAPEFKMQYLFDKTVAMSYDKGLYVEDFVKSSLGENFCIAIDKDSTLHFFDKIDSPSKELKASCLIPGSELSDNTFVWAWANQSLGLPPLPFYSEFANEIQTIGGGCDGISEFITPMLKYREKEELIGLYLLIQGWADLDCFYKVQFGDLQLVAFLNSNSFPRKIVDPVERVCKLFPEVIALCPVVNHRLALEGYLMFYGFTFSESASGLRASLDDQSIQAVFDPEDKLVSITRVV